MPPRESSVAIRWPPVRKIPNVPENAEAYYAPDNLHVIAQTQDACSWFFPDGQRLVWTSTRDHMDMPLGNWSDETEYPQGAELYVSDLKGGDIPTPDGEHLIFRAWKRSEILANKKLRQETGGHKQTSMTIFTMKTDGTDVQPRTFGNDMNWAPFIAPDGQHFFYVRVFEDNNREVVMNDLAGGAT